LSNYSTVTQPTTEPVAVPYAVGFLRAYPDDTPTIGALIPVAREMVEAFTGRALAPATFRLVASAWPSSQIFALERTPVASITSVKYWPDGDGSQVTMTAGTDYRAITTTTPALCQIIDDLPALADRPDAIEIVFVAGAEAASTPAALRHAVLLVVSHLYEQRAPVNVGNITSELPLQLRHLIESHRVGGWMG
jgi:uncharacterized phiE125 gp8 family phage protein